MGGRKKCHVTKRGVSNQGYRLLDKGVGRGWGGRGENTQFFHCVLIE